MVAYRGKQDIQGVLLLKRAQQGIQGVLDRDGAEKSMLTVYFEANNMSKETSTDYQTLAKTNGKIMLWVKMGSWNEDINLWRQIILPKFQLTHTMVTLITYINKCMYKTNTS